MLRFRMLCLFACKICEFNLCGSKGAAFFVRGFGYALFLFLGGKTNEKANRKKADLVRRRICNAPHRYPRAHHLLVGADP